MAQYQVTKKMLERKVEGIQKLGADVGLEWAYGQARVSNSTGSSGISPRGARGLVWNFLDIFEAGFRQGQKHKA